MNSSEAPTKMELIQGRSDSIEMLEKCSTALDCIHQNLHWLGCFRNLDTLQRKTIAIALLDLDALINAFEELRKSLKGDYRDV